MSMDDMIARIEALEQAVLVLGELTRNSPHYGMNPELERIICKICVNRMKRAEVEVPTPRKSHKYPKIG